MFSWYYFASAFVILIIPKSVESFQHVKTPLRRNSHRRHATEMLLRSNHRCGQTSLLNSEGSFRVDISKIESIPAQSDPSRRDVLTQSMLGSMMILSNLPSPSYALSAFEASKAYDSYASNYDSLDGGSASTMLGIDQARADLLKQAKGAVLEIGAGTGLNLEKYDFSKIESLTLLDISQGMLSMAEQRWKNMTVATTSGSNASFISFVQADATSELVAKFGAQSFDTVVDSFSLCTMGNDGAEKCLNQLSQVVKSKEQGGQVLLLENSRSSNPFLAKYQDATSGAAAEMGGKGCVYNQDVESMIQQSTKRKMVIESQEQYAAGLFRAFRCTVA